MPNVYAEDVNFFETSKAGPDKWIDLTKAQIKTLGGKMQAEGFGESDGRAAFMIGFSMGDDRFKVVWPVLPSKRGNSRAARTQAATMLYHYVKSVCLYAVIVGARTAFFSHYLLPDGRMASTLSAPELIEAIPPMLSIE